jgi:hypothetical protein
MSEGQPSGPSVSQGLLITNLSILARGMLSTIPQTRAFARNTQLAGALSGLDAPGNVVAGATASNANDRIGAAAGLMNSLAGFGQAFATRGGVLRALTVASRVSGPVAVSSTLISLARTPQGQRTLEYLGRSAEEFEKDFNLPAGGAFTLT